MIHLISDFFYKNSLYKKWVLRKEAIHEHYAQLEKELISQVDKKYQEMVKDHELKLKDLEIKSEKLDREKGDLENLERHLSEKKELIHQHQIQIEKDFLEEKTARIERNKKEIDDLVSRLIKRRESVYQEYLSIERDLIRENDETLKLMKIKFDETFKELSSKQNELEIKKSDLKDLEKRFADREQEIHRQYAGVEGNLIHEFEEKYKQMRENLELRIKDLSEKTEKVDRDKRDIEDLEKRLADRKIELSSSNQELKDQIRIIEAKAKPDQVWITAFATAFNKSWEMMLPIMREGLEKVKDEIRNQEIEASIPRIDQVVNEKLKKLENYKLMEVQKIESKKRELEIRLSKPIDEREKVKLSNYVAIINWVLGNGDGN